MVSKLKSLICVPRGIFSLLVYTANTIFCCTPLFGVALFKAAIPIACVQNACRKALTAIAYAWVAVNNLNQKYLSGIRWEVTGLENLDPHGWYLVIANHQYWADILILQNIFHGKIPFLKFFIKKELFWFPFLGQAWWALEFPFMKRYTKKFLQKHPDLIGKDMQITKRACEKFRNMPVSIMTFLEGTRFTKQKKAKQNSNYRHLLRAKAGGMAFVLAAMEDELQHIVDVTIAYPHGPAGFWRFLCGRVREVRVHVATLPITSELIGDYLQDAQFRIQFQDWVNNLWLQKDERLTRMLSA